jgi:phage tail-like protein
MKKRDGALAGNPWGAYNFLIEADGLTGAFSDVSGLSTELSMTEYRNGDVAEFHVQKIPLVHKVPDVTLKRGLIGSNELWSWMKDSRTKGAKAKRNVSISLMDELGQNKVQTWKLSGVLPLKYVGPALVAKGGTDVAMEELVLSCEGFEVE